MKLCSRIVVRMIVVLVRKIVILVRMIIVLIKIIVILVRMIIKENCNFRHNDYCFSKENCYLVGMILL